METPWSLLKNPFFANFSRDYLEIIVFMNIVWWWKWKKKIGTASIHMQVSNLNCFDSILTPCKWPQIEMIFFVFQPREGHLSFKHLGLKMELILHMYWAICVDKQKKIWLCTLVQKPFPRLLIYDWETETQKELTRLLFRAYILRLFCDFFPSI